jgi:hypothetical protein
MAGLLMGLFGRGANPATSLVIQERLFGVTDDTTNLYEDIVASDSSTSGGRVTSVVGRIRGFTFTPISTGPQYSTAMSAPTFLCDTANRGMRYNHAAGFGGVFDAQRPTAFSCRVRLPSPALAATAQCGGIDNQGAGSPSISQQTFFLRADATGALSCSRTSASATTTTTSGAGTFVVAGAWRTLGWTYDGTNLVSYVDGVQLHTAANSRSIAGTTVNRLVLFSNFGNGSSLTGGHFGRIRFYNGVRTAAQHLNDHNLFAATWA